MTEISLMLSILEDPFNIFPLESVCGQLGVLVEETNQVMYGRRYGLTSTSPKYRSVEDEHDLAAIDLFIGSAFVLSQTAITQTVSITKRLHSLAGEPAWLPKRKNDIISMEAIIHPRTGLSKFIIYDAIANYFKHHFEWSGNWSNATISQQQTIDVILKLGLEPGNEDNLHIALNNLDISINSMSQMGREIQEWRERLAGRLRSQLQTHGKI